MPPNKQVTFSSREMEVLALAWQCMEQQPKIDMQKLASLTGYTTGSASVTFGNIKRKIKMLGESITPGGTGPQTPSSGRDKSGIPKSSAGTKRGAKPAAQQATPSKKQKTSVANDKHKTAMPHDRFPDTDGHDDDDDDLAIADGVRVKTEVKFEDDNDEPLVQDGFARPRTTPAASSSTAADADFLAGLSGFAAGRLT